MGVFKEFFQFAREEKKYWLYPIIILFIILGAFVFFFQAAASMPFIYALF